MGKKNPFPATDDAAYRKHAEGDRATDIGNMHKNLAKIARGLPEISSRTDRHTDALITILCNRCRGRSHEIYVHV